MTSREELIEEAAATIAVAELVASHKTWGDLLEPQKDEYRRLARTVAAVFEQAHTPTDDERIDLDELEAMIEGAYDLRHVPVYPIRAMIRELRARRTVQGEPSVTVATKPAIDQVRKVLDYYADEIDVSIWQEIASAVDDIPDCETWTAAPHAEHVQGEPTDAQVEAGCVAFYEHASGLTSWSRLVDYDAVLADRYRDGIRRALRAAAATQEGENRG